MYTVDIRMAALIPEEINRKI